MNRDEAIAALEGCDEYMRYSVAWIGTDEQKARMVLDGRFTIAELEAIVLIMRNEPALFAAKELTE